MDPNQPIPGMTPLSSSAQPNVQGAVEAIDPDLMALLNLPKSEQQALVDKAKSENKPQVTPQPTEEKLAEAKPIRLVYKFEGHCPNCKGLVETLEMNIAEKHFVTAFCTKDHKQLRSHEVVDLSPLFVPEPQPVVEAQIIEEPKKDDTIKEGVKDGRHSIPTNKSSKNKV